jgi:hypothetical protein
VGGVKRAHTDADTVDCDVTRTLCDRLDEACRLHGLEWVVLPFDESPEAWRSGPYWGALLVEEQPPQHGGRRFFRYNGRVRGRENLPNPQAVYITLAPMSRRGIKRLLLAQLT